MTKYILTILLFSMALFTVSCGDDDVEPDPVPVVTDYDYHAHIHSPNEEDKKVGDSIHLHINLESMTGEPVHHVKIRIYNKADETVVVYNKPDEAHVHETDGLYEYHDDFVLSNDNGVTEHTDWILEAKVWGHDGPEDGVIMITKEFHVHPE